MIILSFSLASALFLISTGILYKKMTNRQRKIKRLERDKEQLSRQLNAAEKFRPLGILTKNAAHDLNNILSGMATYPDVLLMDAKLEPELENGLHLIKASGLEAAAIVSDLLTISKGFDSEKEMININTVLKRYTGANDFKKTKIDYPDTTVELVLEPELFDISASYIYIEKSVRRLFTHALARTAPQSKARIVFTTTNLFLNPGRAAQENKTPGTYVVLSVSDNGAPIKNETEKHYFDPFYSEKKMKDITPGLGLAVVHHAVQDHGGYIDIESGISGTRFDLLFPATLEQKQTD